VRAASSDDAMAIAIHTAFPQLWKPLGEAETTRGDSGADRRSAADYSTAVFHIARPRGPFDGLSPSGRTHGATALVRARVGATESVYSAGPGVPSPSVTPTRISRCPSARISRTSVAGPSVTASVSACGPVPDGRSSRAGARRAALGSRPENDEPRGASCPGRRPGVPRRPGGSVRGPWRR
jgi:hypothetical protein